MNQTSIILCVAGILVLLFTALLGEKTKPDGQPMYFKIEVQYGK